MLKKIVTTVGLVSVFGASTAYGQADINLSAASFTPYKIASETKDTANQTAGTGANIGTTFFDVVKGANADIDVEMTQGFVGAVTGTADYFVKVELTNAAYSTAAQALAISPLRSGGKTSGTVSLFSGGTVGSSSAIYQFDITQSLASTSTLNLTFTDIATNGNPTVKMSIFETLTEANKAAGTAVTSASKEIINFTPGLKKVTTVGSETAEVSTGFVKYKLTATTQDLTGQMGSVVHSVNAGVSSADDGVVAVLADLYTAATSVVTVTGDLSNGTWWMDAGACLQAAAIPAGDKLVLNAAKTSGTVTGTILDAKANLCNLTDGVAVIPQSGYTIGINYSPGTIATTAGAADYTGVNIGAIGRNGTTQQINYLTTFASYNQRIYITNRGSVDATYAFTFQSEDGTTATAGTAATGTSKASSVLALKASDVVTLTGKTRTAATLTIVGTPGNFGVATQQVNLSNGATDTVVYKGIDSTNN
jgi:hypothetical protein